MTESAACPDCGAPLSADRWSDGLCLSCLLQLGLSSGAPPVAAGGAVERPTVIHAPVPLADGQILGDRYRLRTLLGRGGMGEVFRAFDLKLRVDVALKAVRPLVFDDRALAWLRQEVRTAREIVSPNVCRVFDLVEVDGRELVAMEYVDGATLAEVLRERSPLGLQEARGIAAQLLAGLDAIHGAGLVHRDIKPENVMLTRAGRVVVMDFGITRAASESRVRTVAGTAAYMAPEQALGGAVDARADLYSAGVVLAELVAPGGARTPAAREAVWRRIRETPPRLDDTPWAEVLRRAVDFDRDRRYATAAALSRAFDEVTLRTTGDESMRPYPGLAAFTERDAGFFVGRELEIETMWRRLRRPHLQALIGPSGAGKSSFLHAGLSATAPDGWSVIFATPGTRPFAALAHALAPELAGDADAVARLIDVEQPGVAVEVVTRWRQRHDHALLVLDQFEELFTLNNDDVQARFADLLARLALDAGVHVLLSMRDDFLFRCQRFESLAPVFSEITAIGPPAGAALRRALVQPALKCGYRFEDDAMVDEMLAEVTGERAALPLAAFAMARLWDTRDRERGMLTRAAYESIGGVAGALAQHAEATLDTIGHDHVPVVRELFRNLVTAQGTRATRDREELLSVFEAGARDSAAAVLDALVDARLLTAYDTEATDNEAAGRRRIEIVHESLLTAWPRLVRWQIQDQDGAQLRDQLRQVARLWEARGKPEDLLWTGTSFREFELWRERYAGTLSEAENTFARAMTARAARHRMQRRAGVGALVVASLVVAIGMSMLWRQSEGARQEADAAARHAEAQQLFALGQLELERQPSVAVAYALASLERNDNPEVRNFAVRALSQGPTPVIVARTEAGWGGTELSFSRTGEWLSSLNVRMGAVRLWRKDGSARQIPESGSPGDYASGGFADDEGSFVLTVSDSIRFHGLPDVTDVNRIPGSFRWGFVRGASLVTGDLAPPLADGRLRRLIRTYPVPEGAPATGVGIVTHPRDAAGSFVVDPSGDSIVGLFDGSLFESSLRHIDRPPRLLVRADGDPIFNFNLSADGSRLFLHRRSTALSVVSRATGAVLPSPDVASLEEAGSGRAISADGRRMAIGVAPDQVHVHDLAAPPGVDPMIVRLASRPLSVAIHPNGSWLAVQDNRTISLWPMTWRHARVLRPGTRRVGGVAADPAGRWIASGGPGVPVNVWSVSEQAPTGRTTLEYEENANRATPPRVSRPALGKIDASPRGDLLAAGTFSGLWLLPLAGTPERLPGFNSIVRAVAFDRSGRWLAAGGGILGELVAPGENVVRVWDLETRAVRVLAVPDAKPIAGVAFLPDGRLVAGSAAGLRVWDLTSGTSTLLLTDMLASAKPSPDGRRVLVFRAGPRPGGAVGTAAIYDVETGRTTPLPSHGNLVTCVAWHPSGEQVVTGSQDGTVRIGPADGREPHLLLGHTAQVFDVVVDPRGRWVASGGDDGTTRLWPMPEDQPFHTLPHAALLDRDSGTQIAKAEASHVFGQSWFLSGKFAYVDVGFGLTPQGGVNTQAYRDFAAQEWHGSYQLTRQDRTQHQGQVDGNWQRGIHDVKFGFQHRQTSRDDRAAWPGDGTYTVINAEAVGLPPGVGFANLTRASVLSQETGAVSVYGGDVLAFDRWTVDLGLRVDWQRIRNRPSRAPANGLAPSILPALEYAGGPYHEWTDWSPRLGVTVRASGRTLVRGSYARYPSQQPNLATFENPASMATIQYRFADANGDHLAQVSELLGPTGSVTGVNPADPAAPYAPNRVDPDIISPATHVLIGGVEHEVLPGFSLALRVGQSDVAHPTWSRFIGLTRDDFVEYRTAGTATVASDTPVYRLAAGATLPPGQARWLTNRDDYHRRYWNVDVVATRRLGDGWMLRGFLTRQQHRERFTGDAGIQDPTARFDNMPPSVSGYVDGGLAVSPGEIVMHATWLYSVAGLYELPWRMSVSGTIYGRQGYPTAEIITVNRPDGLGLTQVLRDRDLDSGRFPDLHLLDVRLQKQLSLGRAQATLDLDLFNTFNTASTLRQIGEATAASFRTPLEMVAPRLVRLGLRLQF